MKTNKQELLPAEVAKEISIYFEPGEDVLKHLCVIDKKMGDGGEVWLILTGKSLFFHTRQRNKEPVVAMLPRKNIKYIEYFERKNEISLTFVPVSNPLNTTKIAFPIAQKELLESFCEDLAELIEYKKETDKGVKVLIRPQINNKNYVEPDLARQNSDKPKKKATADIKTVKNDKLVKLNKVNETKPFVKGKSAKDGFVDTSSDIKIVKPESEKGNGKNEESAFSAGYVLAATLISVVVAYIWYKFFTYISKRKK